MVIIYRYSNNPDLKPKIADKSTCLHNFVVTCLANWRNEKREKIKVFFAIDTDLDAPELNLLVQAYSESPDVEIKIVRGDCSSAAKSQHLALDIVEQQTTLYETIYLLEDDFIHRHEALKLLQEGLAIFDYVTLYDHPDKYLVRGPNRRVTAEKNGFGAEDTRVFLTKSCHWKETDSTVMTFAARLGTLLTDMLIIRESIGEQFPDSYNMFERLRVERKRTVGSSIPGYSTHAETAWLAPCVDWLYEVTYDC